MTEELSTPKNQVNHKVREGGKVNYLPLKEAQMKQVYPRLVLDSVMYYIYNYFLSTLTEHEVCEVANGMQIRLFQRKFSGTHKAGTPVNDQGLTKHHRPSQCTFNHICKRDRIMSSFTSTCHTPC